jgi:NADH dehydrogenase
METKHQQPHVVIVGGGFGGLNAAIGLRRAPVRVTLVDRRNYHLFQPLLYQVATAALSPADVAYPIRWVVRRQKNTTVLLADAVSVDVAARRLVLSDGALDYDYLVLAPGARHSYFGHDAWEPLAPGLKTLEDALEIRRRVLLAFEEAERATSDAERERLLTFVVIGGGPTGVELAGALAEIARHTLATDFRTFDPRRARVILLEGAPRVLMAYDESLSASAKRQLERLGVTVRTGAHVEEIDPARGVRLKVTPTPTAPTAPPAPGMAASTTGPASPATPASSSLPPPPEWIATKNVLWAAGVAASPLARSLGVPLDRSGRVTVEPDLSLPGHPEVFVIGDLSLFMHQTGKPLPGVAPLAIQMGRTAAKNIALSVAGAPRRPFLYFDKGSLATIGRSSAVADFGWFRLTGFPAWAAWCLIHIFFLIGFRNRIVVMFEWMWAYLTRQRGARLITYEEESPSPPGPATPTPGP